MIKKNNRYDKKSYYQKKKILYNIINRKEKNMSNTIVELVIIGSLFINGVPDLPPNSPLRNVTSIQQPNMRTCVLRRDEILRNLNSNPNLAVKIGPRSEMRNISEVRCRNSEKFVPDPMGNLN